MNPAVILLALLLLDQQDGTKGYISSAAVRPVQGLITKIPAPRIPSRIEPFQLELMADKLRDTAESLDRLKGLDGLRQALPSALPQMIPNLLPMLLKQASSYSRPQPPAGEHPPQESQPMAAIRNYLADHKEASQQSDGSNQMADMMAAFAPFLAQIQGGREKE